MITGDNPLTAAAIAREAGVDDFMAEATPEDKMERCRREQAGGNLVAMTGDGTNDAPALAVADVGVAMNTGTQAAKEAGNMVDLDSDPTKLMDIVEIGKQLLITRGSLTTFSIANDVAKYFAIIPAMFAGVFPALNRLNIMKLQQPAHGHPLGRDLQRDHHRDPDPVGAARRQVQGHGCERDPQTQHPHLRRRRDHRAVHSHQAHRHAPHRARGALMIIRRILGPAAALAIVLAVLTGILYPLSVWAIGQVTMSHRANGSFITQNGKTIGSALIGQSFLDKDGNPDPRYFQSRPSAVDYNAAASGASNLGPADARLIGFVPGLNITTKTNAVRHAERPELRAGAGHRQGRQSRHRQGRQRGVREEQGRHLRVQSQHRAASGCSRIVRSTRCPPT